MTIGDRIRAYRDLAGISSKELDRLAGLSPGATWAAERSDKDNPHTKTARGIARVLGLSLDHLVNGTGAPPTEEQVRAAVATAQAAQSSDSGEHPAADSDAEAS